MVPISSLYAFVTNCNARVVFPEAALKIFLTAELETRVGRRRAELLANGIDLSLDEIRSNLAHRDHIDSSRQHSPLLKTSDAVLIDNSNLTRQEQLEMIATLAICRMRPDSNESG